MNLVDQIMNNENPIIPVSEQSQLKADLYFRALVIRENGRLVLREGITLNYKVKTFAPNPLNVVWSGGDKAPKIVKRSA